MTTWYEPHKSILHTKRDGSRVIIKLGDCITHSRHELPIRVDKFTFLNDNEVIGFEYLPWRGTRWGTPAFSMRGNPRHIICMPGGIMHYGLHIEWDTVQVVPNPDPSHLVHSVDSVELNLDKELDTDELVKKLELLQSDQFMQSDQVQKEVQNENLKDLLREKVLKEELLKQQFTFKFENVNVEKI
jgi:hypothetical protein